jgi:DNA-binding MarR family transcriptional regulator
MSNGTRAMSQPSALRSGSRTAVNDFLCVEGLIRLSIEAVTKLPAHFICKLSVEKALTMVSKEIIIVSMETTLNAKHSISELESHLGYWLRRISNSVSRQFAQSLRVRETSVAEWVLLRLLYEREQASPGELADVATMTRGAISKVVDKLQAKGWIRSRVNPKDSRGQVLSLTPAGKRNLPELAEIADQNDEQFFACLDAGERSALRHLLSKLAEHHQLRGVPVD